MPVVFEFQVGKGFHFSKSFGERFNMPCVNDRVYLPEQLGDGFIQEVYLKNGLALCLHHYVLKQEFILKRLPSTPSDSLTIKFDYRGAIARANEGDHEPLFTDSKDCEVELGTSNFFTELTIPPNQAIDFLVIGTTRQILLALLDLNIEEHPIENTIMGNQSFVIHEGMSQQMGKTLKQLAQINENTKLASLLYQTKTQELIYLLFTKLLSRTTRFSEAINPTDAKKIYEIKTHILADLSITPQLPELASASGMSLTKMKQLFRQIFGDSIYNYYQAARMNEAAQLLNHLSVSETGYKIGFSNLSHFSRLFEKHHQMKPKRFKNTLQIA